MHGTTKVNQGKTGGEVCSTHLGKGNAYGSSVDNPKEKISLKTQYKMGE
jgi:hypothetical protein